MELKRLEDWETEDNELKEEMNKMRLIVECTCPRPLIDDVKMVRTIDPKCPMHGEQIVKEVKEA